jgi:hypothetical protein
MYMLHHDLDGGFVYEQGNRPETLMVFCYDAELHHLLVGMKDPPGVPNPPILLVDTLEEIVKVTKQHLRCSDNNLTIVDDEAEFDRLEGLALDEEQGI